VEHPLRAFSKNIFSQFGEDGILEEIFKRLNFTDQPQWCVEFGAWDGKLYSNTFNFVSSHGWRAVYIEADSTKFTDLQKTARDWPNIIPIHAFVVPEAGDEQSLERLLSKTPIPKDFALLSIDVDSYDLDIWESLHGYSPAVVVIEVESSFPPGILIRYDHIKGVNHFKDYWAGNSFSATVAVGKEKGYQCVCHTGNVIFVRNDLVHKIGLDQRYLLYPELSFDPKWYRLDFEPRTGVRYHFRELTLSLLSRCTRLLSRQTVE